MTKSNDDIVTFLYTTCVLPERRLHEASNPAGSFIHFNRHIFTTDLRPCEHDNRVKALRGRRRAIFTTSFRSTDHTTTTT